MSTLKETLNITEYLKRTSERYSERVAHSLKKQDGWTKSTYKDLNNAVRTLSNKLTQSGIVEGDNVLIICRNRPEALISFLACAIAGVIAVPIDPRMSIFDLQFIFKHSDTSAIIILSAEDHLLAKQINEDIRVIHSDYSISTVNKKIPKKIVELDDTALIIYTSGTTSQPKGVMITFRNLQFEVETIINDTFKLKSDLRHLSILPLNHIFEFITGLLIPFTLGGEICYGNSLLPSEVIATLNERKIKEMVCVPLFLRMFKKGIEAKFNENKILKTYFHYGLKLSGLINHTKTSKILFYPLHIALGGEMRRFISGGASLDKDVEEFFYRIGIPVYQGYGLTETCAVVCANAPNDFKAGSVGKPIKGVEIKIDPITGEILIKGPNVMKGYYKNAELTKEVLVDGWFNSGDVGTIDNQGFLNITGRIKELIVLANGKKVTPDEVEQELLRDSLVLREACVIGSNIQKGAMKGVQEVCAVVIPNNNYFDLEDEEIIEMLSEKLSQMTDYKRPSRILVQRTEFEKTATMKTKRLKVKAQLDQEYLSL